MHISTRVVALTGTLALMAAPASAATTNPATTCKGASKQHVAGTPGTPFSHCVSDVAHGGGIIVTS